MAISKVLKCSRAFPLGSIWSWYQIVTFSGCELLIFINLLPEIYDVLCFRVEKLYFCRYKFPRDSWNDEKIFEYFEKEL